jgi:3-deoxy-D-manno-octulosonic acid (KDO) 8-phosphate synthase
MACFLQENMASDFAIRRSSEPQPGRLRPNNLRTRTHDNCVKKKKKEKNKYVLTCESGASWQNNQSTSTLRKVCFHHNHKSQVIL